jgi:hypothetical protein
MGIYSLSNRTTNVTVANPCLEIIAGAAVRPKVLEIGIFMAAATASTFGIGRPAATGITPTTPVTMIAEDEADPAGEVTTALAWGTEPTVPTAFFRRIALAGAVGTGIIFTFPKGLYIPAGESIVVWNISDPTGVSDIYVVIED